MEEKRKKLHLLQYLTNKNLPLTFSIADFKHPQAGNQEYLTR